MAKKDAQVDLELNTVRFGKKTYHYDDEGDDWGDRIWYLKSKKWVEDEYGNRYRVQDVEESMGCWEEEDFTPVEIPVRKPKTVKYLNRLVEQATKQEEERKAAQDNEGDGDHTGNGDENVKDSTEEEKRRIREAGGDDVDETDRQEESEAESNKRDKARPARKTQKSRNTLSVRFQDVDSGHSFDFYMSPSKKKRNSYFVAVYQGRRPLRYANVKPQAILDFKEKLAALSVKG